MKNFMLFITLSFLVTSCEVPEQVQKILGYFKTPSNEGVATPTPVPTATPSELAAKAKANSELLAEMLQVLFNEKEAEDPSNFGSLVSTLNQGASFEGIYRGLVMSSRYRVLESKAKAASPATIKFFAKEMAILQASMKEPTVFDKKTAKDFPSIEYPEGDNGASPDSYDFGNQKKAEEPVAQKKSENEIIEEYLQVFIGATPYAMKRILADEVMKKIDEMKDSPGEIAQWYASFVARMTESGIDFGLKQRNSSDFDFHFKFAKSMPLDRVRWEVLNRYFRVINKLG